MSACSPSTPASTVPMTGHDKDTHGCRGSAGYVWSPAQQRCMRLFEEAFAFDPHMDNPDQTLKAFVVLGPDMDKPQKADLFLPNGPYPMALDVVKTTSEDMRPVVLRNAAEQVEVVRVKDMYVLSIHGQVKFSHDAVIDSPLGKI